MISIKKVALTFGIAILFTLFIVFLIDAVYQTPKYEDYCNSTYYNQPYPVNTIENSTCSPVNNEALFNQCYKEKGEIKYKYDEKGCVKETYCDYCSKSFNDVNSKYNKNIFYLSALIGIIAIIISLYLPVGIDAISSGFIFGGILIIVQGTFRVFGDLGKVSKVIVLGVELVLLVWIGYRKVRDRKK